VNDSERRPGDGSTGDDANAARDERKRPRPGEGAASEGAGHPLDHERLLESLVVGDLDFESTEAREAEESCEVCRARLSELRAVDAHLEAAASVEAAVLERARSMGEVPGSVAARRALGDASGIDRAGSGGRFGASGSGWRIPVLIAAGLVLFAGGFLAVRSLLPPADMPSDGPVEELYYGVESDDLTLLPPEVEGDRIVEFSWHDAATRSPTKKYRITVYERGDDGEPVGDPVATAKDIEELRWRPYEDSRTGGTIEWPEHIVWIVVVEGDVTPEPFARASVSPWD